MVLLRDSSHGRGPQQPRFRIRWVVLWPPQARSSLGPHPGRLERSRDQEERGQPARLGSGEPGIECGQVVASRQEPALAVKQGVAGRQFAISGEDLIQSDSLRQRQIVGAPPTEPADTQRALAAPAGPAGLFRWSRRVPGDEDLRHEGAAARVTAGDDLAEEVSERPILRNPMALAGHQRP